MTTYCYCLNNNLKLVHIMYIICKPEDLQITPTKHLQVNKAVSEQQARLILFDSK